MAIQNPTPGVLVTGSTGFVGRALCRRLLDLGFRIRACVHNNHGVVSPLSGRAQIDFYHLGDIATTRSWEEPLEGMDAVVHLAARVHLTRDSAADPLAEYMRTNVSATQQLAEAAARNARRFVFISSIKVNGERTNGKGFDEEDPASPEDPYAVSKWEAEKALRCIAAHSGLELVIIRPPLVYGPGVQANFLRLFDLVYRGVPLPLPHSSNRRSLIGVENLADLIVRCLEHPAAVGQDFVASDGEDISTRELVNRIAQALGRPCRVLPLPESWLRLGASILNKDGEATRLLGSLVVNSTKARDRLGWKPPMSLADGLAATAKWYIETRARRS